jgi:DNA-binding NarL/FixJ family response regulator
MISSAKILIADDHTLLRDGIRSILKSVDHFEIVGEVDNGKDAIHFATTLQPDLIVIDLSMPGTNGAEAIQRIHSRHPEIKILVLTVHSSEEYVHAALKAGASGYLLKDDSSEEFIKALNNILSGKTHLSASICGNVVTGYLSDQINQSNHNSSVQLTTREREIIKLIAEGYRNKDVAEYLSISLKTVEKHRSNLMKKLNLHNVSGITSYAIKNGFVTQLLLTAACLL